MEYLSFFYMKNMRDKMKENNEKVSRVCHNQRYQPCHENIYVIMQTTKVQINLHNCLVGSVPMFAAYID